MRGSPSEISNEDSVHEEEEVKESNEEINEPEEEVKESEEQTKEVEEMENKTVANPSEVDSTLTNESEGSDNELENVNNQSHTVPEADISNEAEKCANEIMAIKIESSLKTVSSETLPPLKVPEERPWSEGDSSVYSKVQVCIIFSIYRGKWPEMG